MGTSGLIKKVLRFGAVGGVFAGVFAALSAFFVGTLGMSPYWAPVILYAVCIPAAFLVQMKFTFGARAWQPTGLFLYATTQLTCISVGAFFVARLVTGNFILDGLLYLAIAGISALVSFTICNRATVSDRTH
ncbi:MAG: hypothetical protein AAF762_02275 [Pseudomonadota bacterium]